MMEDEEFEPLKMEEDLSLQIGIFCWENIPDVGKCEQSQQAYFRNSRPHSHGAKVQAP